MLIGIDFGTCYTTAAIMNGLIPVTTFMRDTTGMGIPTLFRYSVEEDRELYGEECLTGDSYRHSADIVRNMKRTVREDPSNLGKTVFSGGREYTVGQVIEKYLTYIISEVRAAAIRSGEYRNTEIEGVTITAPVGIADGQMLASDYNRLIRDTVVRITNLSQENVRVLQEPVAAAISYLYSEDIRTRYEGVQRIMVFDLGGGTLDVSLVEHDPATREYRILSKAGDLELGGNDWDSELASAVLGKLGIDTWNGSEEEHARFMTSITKLKTDLTLSDESMIFFTMGGEDKYTRFSRSEFDGCTRHLLDRALSVMDSALEGAGNGDVLPHRIVLVGGSCNMPQIAEGIREHTGYSEDEVCVYEPSKAIAKGAAVFSKFNYAIDGSARGVKVLDSASQTYGFRSRFNGEEHRIYNMIYKGTPFGDDDRISVRSESDFIPMRDDQTCVNFDIYESEAIRGDGEDADWFDMGCGEVANGLRVTVQVPPEFIGRARGFRMWVTLTLDSNGILEITVTDRAGNRIGFASNIQGVGQ